MTLAISVLCVGLGIALNFFSDNKEILDRMGLCLICWVLCFERVVFNEHILTIPLPLIFRKLGNSFPGEVLFSILILADNSVSYFGKWMYENMDWRDVSKARKHFIFLITFLSWISNKWNRSAFVQCMLFSIVLHWYFKWIVLPTRTVTFRQFFFWHFL